jgi:hypothetical protein
MATDLAQAKAAATSKHDAFVQAQLARTEKRIRALDLTAALLGLAAGTLAYAVVMALIDRWLALPQGVRQAGFVVYLVAAAAYLTAFVVLPLSRRINPYFAARQLERTLPGAKNSVVNWLDLHAEDLPPAIRGAVGQRAAKDLARADVEKAVSSRRAYSVGGVAALCALGFLVALFTLGFGPFFSFISRAFAPFSTNGSVSPTTSTRITVVKPSDGDAVVPDDRPVEILVRVDGRVPNPKAGDALKMYYRYEPSAAYRQRPLEPDDGGRWGVTLPAVDVQEGFLYKVTGGDAETKEYRVRLTPRVLDFKAVYQFRPYTARVNETRKERKIDALRGTQVDVTVHTNRDLKEGWLQFEGAHGTTVAHGDLVPGDQQGFTAHLTLDESSQYRICFTSVDSENFVEPQAYPLIAVPDNPPVVTLTSPAERKDKPSWIPDVPANSVLPLEGSATDDVGVKAMRLNLRVDNGPTLPPQEYRTPKDFQLPHGGNPTKVEYKDFVDLPKVKNPADALFTVRPGMVLEYWLTAEDACDYPDPNKPNVGESKHYRVQIIDPLHNDQVRKQQQDKAQQDKQDNEKKQDEQNQKEDQKRDQDNQQKKKQGDAANKPNAGDASKDKGDKPGDPQHQDGSKPDSNPNDGNKTGMGENKPQDTNQQNPGASDKPNKPNPDSGENAKDNKDLHDAAKDATKQIRNSEEGAGKSDPKDHQADGKDAGQPQRQPQPGDAKEGGAPQERKDAAQPKSGPQDKPGEQHDEGAAKEQGQPDAKQPQQGEAKPGAGPKAQPDTQPALSKDGKSEAAPQPADNKDGGKPDDQKQAAAEKPQSGAPGDKTEKAEKKEGNPPGMADAQQAGEAKDKAKPENKSEAKGPGQDPHDKDAAQSKGDGAATPMEKPERASGKPGEEKPPNDKTVAQKKSDGSEGDPPQDDAKQLSEDEAFKKLQDDLKSGDPNREQAAEEFTRRYLTHANDPEIRDRAKKMLEDAGLDPDDSKPAQNKPEELPHQQDAPQPEHKPPPAEGKQSPGQDMPPTTKDNPPDQQPNDPTKGESKGDGKPTDSDPKNAPPPPATPKFGPGNGSDENRHGEPPPNVTQATPPTPEKPVAQKASTLQLLKFYEAVPKDVLKDALLDPEKRKALEDAMRNYLAKHPASDDKDNLTDPQHGGLLPNTVGKTSGPDAKGSTDDPNNGGRPQPPPEYRGPYKDFTKLLSPGSK